MNKFILQKLFDLNLFIKILLKALYIISIANKHKSNQLKLLNLLNLLFCLINYLLIYTI